MGGAAAAGESGLLVDVIALISMTSMRTLASGATRDAYGELNLMFIR